MQVKLPTLKYRRVRGDMIEIYKMLTGKYDRDSCIEFKFVTYPGTHTRGGKTTITVLQISFQPSFRPRQVENATRRGGKLTE